ncbi:MAG TPA: hypothetical protein VMU25_03335 [Candidatus Paceibacterota bacterium]|nr:hypothetical protein [Candidatus Paceibacterota bacterium]
MIGTTTPVQFVVQIVAQIPVMLAQTTAHMFWMIVTTLWAAYWPYILVVMTVWVVIELVTRNGGLHYNSENGFSPTFNRVVGSGVLILFQAGIYALIRWLFGDDSYLHIWPYPVHIAGFFLTGLFLNLTGFWVYWRLPRL